MVVAPARHPASRCRGKPLSARRKRAVDPNPVPYPKFSTLSTQGPNLTRQAQRSLFVVPRDNNNILKVDSAGEVFHWGIGQTCIQYVLQHKKLPTSCSNYYVNY